MAASNAYSSLDWIVDLDKFKSILEDSYVTEDSLRDVVNEECIQQVLYGIIQLKYWRRKLEPQFDSRTMVLACLGPNGLIKPDIPGLYEIMESKVGSDNISSVYYSENDKFSGFNFVSSVAAEQARQEGATLGEALICYIYHNPVAVHDVRILWAPAFTALESICEIFEKFTTNINISFESVDVKPGCFLPSNIASGKITMKDGISVDKIPHVVKIPGSENKYVLIIIRNRLPLCLKCRMIGHYRKQCSFSYCTNCKVLHDKRLQCQKSTYATVVGKLLKPSASHVEISTPSIYQFLSDQMEEDVKNCDTGEKKLDSHSIPIEGVLKDTQNKPKNQKKRGRDSGLSLEEKSLKARRTKGSVTLADNLLDESMSVNSVMVPTVSDLVKGGEDISLLVNKDDTNWKNVAILYPVENNSTTPMLVKGKEEQYMCGMNTGQSFPQKELNIANGVHSGTTPVVQGQKLGIVNIDSVSHEGIKTGLEEKWAGLYCKDCHGITKVKIPVEKKISCFCGTPLIIVKNDHLVESEKCDKPPDWFYS